MHALRVYINPFVLAVTQLTMRSDSRNVLSVNTTSFGNLIFNLPPEEKSLVRKLEKLYYKLNSAEAAATFNKICLQEGLLPK